jgi:cbb3-type cytochrome oxidase maturation protein
MYFPYLIAYMVAGFVISLVTFLWALNAGQFKDQRRARFLPLEGEPEMAHERAPRHYRIMIFVLFALACSGLVATAAVIAFTVIKDG